MIALLLLPIALALILAASWTLGDTVDGDA